MCRLWTPQNVRAQYKLLRRTCVHTKNPKRACRVLQHHRALVPAHFAVFDEELVGDPAIFALDQTSSYKWSLLQGTWQMSTPKHQERNILLSKLIFSRNRFVLFEKSCRRSARILSQKYITQILYRQETLHPLANPIHPIQAPSHPIRSDIHDQTDM